MTSPGDVQFGRLAMAHNLVTSEELAGALQHQEEVRLRKGVAPRLGEVLISLGLITDQQVQQLLAEQASSTGSKLLGGYELMARIGSGGMGAVYKARQISLNRIVALKVLPQRLARDREFLARFYREARSVAKLSHPNIVSGFDVGESDGYHYLAMEFVDGGSAADLLLQNPKGLGSDRVIDLGLQTASALLHAHQNGIIHRDVKPENILISGNGTAKLCDLGLARSARHGEAALTQAGVAVGTPYYISPEQARAKQELDHRSDIYSLGATLFHLATGQPPFTGDNAMHIMTRHIEERPALASDVNAAVLPALAAVIDKMLSKKCQDRHQTMVQVMEDMELLRGGKPPKHSRIPAARAAHSRGTSLHTTNSRVFKPIASSRHYGAGILLAALALLAVAAIAGWVLFVRSDSTKPPDHRVSSDPAERSERPGKTPDTHRRPVVPDARAVAIAELLGEAEKYTADNPNDLAGQIALFQEVLAQAGPSSSAGQAASRQIERARALMANSVQEAFAPIRERVQRLCRELDFTAALQALAAPPPDFPFRDQPATAEIFSAEQVSVQRAVAERWAQLSAEADRLIAQHDFARARALLDAAEQLPLPKLKTQLAQRRAAIASAEKEEARSKREKAEKSYTDFLPNFRALIARRDYAGAAELADRVRPGLPDDLAASLAVDMNDLKLVCSVFETAGRAIEAHNRKPGSPLRLTGVGGKLYDGKFVKFSGGVVTLKVQGNVEIPFRLSELPAGEILEHAGLAQPVTPEDIGRTVAFVLLDGMATRDQVQEALGLARRKDIDVSRYVRPVKKTERPVPGTRNDRIVETPPPAAIRVLAGGLSRTTLEPVL
jgi:serine/threonine-protein kinase